MCFQQQRKKKGKRNMNKQNEKLEIRSMPESSIQRGNLGGYVLFRVLFERDVVIVEDKCDDNCCDDAVDQRVHAKTPENACAEPKSSRNDACNQRWVK
jgi:hypothetical protein